MANPPFTLPKVAPKWKRSFQSVDIQPSQIAQSSELNAADIHITCPTCNVHEARYTCPKCMVPYCSTACYKIHDVPSNNPMEGGGRCTEEFYRDKVSQVTDLHVKDEKNASQMRDILTRSFYNGENDEDNNIDNGKPEINAFLTDEELMELAASGLTLDEDDDDPRDDERLLQSLPDHIRLKFENAVTDGELSHLVEKWHPFWLPKDGSDQFEFDSTFEEKIIAIPPLPHKMEENTKNILQNNICEVIYMAALAFRKGNDTTMPQLDAENGDTAAQVATILYSQSQVLSCDARYDSIEEVLLRSSEAFSIISSSDRVLDQKMLVNDIRVICRHRRMVLKVLLELIEVIDHARNILKRRLGSDSKKERRNLLFAKKKIHFYASFCQTSWNDCSTSILASIEKWMHDWAPGDEERQEISDKMLINRARDSKALHKTHKTDYQVKLRQETCNMDDSSLIAVTTKSYHS